MYMYIGRQYKAVDDHYRGYHHVLGVCPCISGCEYDGNTICSAFPPAAPGCWLVHGLPSRTSTGTATRLGDDNAFAAAAA